MAVLLAPIATNAATPAMVLRVLMETPEGHVIQLIKMVTVKTHFIQHASQGDVVGPKTKVVELISALWAQLLKLLSKNAKQSCVLEEL